MYYRIKELCIKLVIKISLYYDAPLEKHQIPKRRLTGRLRASVKFCALIRKGIPSASCTEQIFGLSSHRQLSVAGYLNHYTFVLW
jgi:hypothetical protein